MTKAEVPHSSARETLAAYMQHIGTTSACMYTDALVAAYELGNAENFAMVLCDVSVPDSKDVCPLEVVQAFMLRVNS